MKQQHFGTLPAVLILMLRPMRLSGKKLPFPGISRNTLAAFAVAMLVAACGGGGGDAPTNASHDGVGAGTTGVGNSAHLPSTPSMTGTPDGQNDHAGSRTFSRWTMDSEADVSRFMAQASFGARERDLKELKGSSVNDWIEKEFAKPQTKLLNVIDAWKAKRAEKLTMNDTYYAWWYASQQDDQLRQRMAWALSQIFVVSAASGTSEYPRGMANYHDLLAANAFGNFRQLLEDVTLNPMMGIYLTHLRNRAEQYNNAGDQTSSPDENYAREVMQLFTIGLEMLNPDGSVKRDGRGEAIPTYNNDDILGLARVFTGWSWGGPRTSYDCFVRHQSCSVAAVPDLDVVPMKAYPQYHSTKEKHFLGVTIPEGQATPVANLKIALDTLFNHPNVGPFIGRQLIQRLVTSNPSPAYVRRVADAFNNNGAGVRGDMKAVIRAILLDEEARRRRPNDPAAGRIREPVLRLAQLMRAFDAKSLSGEWRLGWTDGAGALNQMPYRSPSVFNFYRPGYSPANTAASRAGLVAPEMQILNESSLAGIAGYFHGTTNGSNAGLGSIDLPNPDDPGKTVRKREIPFDYTALAALAERPEALVDHVDRLLTGGQMKADTRRTIIDAVSRAEYVRYRTKEQVNLNRAGLAVYLTVMSTDYQVQK
ncbi:MAG: DUF1800 domain-containing protein [Lautropia sp.]|nr:DUF1800 domain-containing protein [Lautropia sp.]